MSDEKTKPQPTALEPEDFYWDGPYMVFTSAYHMKRGACCGSRCRHCPYGLAPESESVRSLRVVNP
ncbi:MAG: DUF5522 domain-containing protein [Acidobacteriaceae bacterium]